MRVREAGKICDNLWYLGREESGVYLLEGSACSMIINGGLSCIIPDVLRQLEAFGLDEGKIKKMLILHAHFDHVGIVPFFKRRNPALEIYASKRAWQILQTPTAIDTINLFSAVTSEKLGKTDDIADFDLEWRNDISGITVAEGDAIDLGDESILIIETPGHSSCSISAYVPSMKTLFPSDGGGIPFKNIIVPSGNSNYTVFQQSLEKLRDLDVAYFCADHYGYVAGEEAKSFVENSINAARLFRNRIEAVYRRKGSVEASVRQLVDDTKADLYDYVLPEDILAGIYGQMVKHIAKDLENEE